MAKTNFGANEALDSAPADRLALFSATPTEESSGTELVGNGYARAVVTWAAAAGGQKATSAECVMETATADWLPIVAVGLLDSEGNLHDYQPLSTHITVLEGQHLKIPAGGLILRQL